MALRAVNDRELASESVQTIVAENKVQDVLAALDDADCRTILDATAEEALSAHEVTESSDLSLSTTYRKLDLLTEAGLLEERIRVRRSGKHVSEYIRLIDEIAITLDSSGKMKLQLSQRRPINKPNQFDEV